MARIQRVLLPAASPLHFFGAEVRRLRIEKGWSQDELGRAIIASEDLVRRVETAERFPTHDFVSRCNVVLDSQGYLLRMWPMVARERALQLGHGGAQHSPAYRSELCDRPVLDWLIADSQPPANVQNVSEERFGEELSRLRQLDHRHGAGVNYPEVSGNLSTVQAASPRTAIGFLELAGYEAVDLGADGAAQRHYLHALETAMRVSDRLHGGYLIAVSLAHLALHCGDPGQAARLCTAALQGTTGVSSPATRAAFRMVLGRACARQGDERGATAAVLQAERELERSRPGAEPRFISYFGQADLADERAHAFFDLGKFRQAQTEAKAAIKAVDPSRMRRQAIDNALLASALACTGELEEACAAGMRAVDCTAATVSFRSVHRIMVMLGHLQPNLSLPVVRELFDYTHQALPATAPTLPSPV